MIRLGVFRDGLCAILATAMMTSPLAGMPSVAHAQDGLGYCEDYYDPSYMASFQKELEQKFNDGVTNDQIKHPYVSAPCLDPNGKEMQLDVDWQIIQVGGNDELKGPLYSPTLDELHAMKKQSTKTQVVTNKCIDLINQDYSALTAEAKSKFDRYIELEVPYASSQCVDNLGNVVDFTVTYEVYSQDGEDHFVHDPIFSPSAAELAAQLSPEDLRQYEQPISEEDRIAVTTQEERAQGANVKMYVIGAVVVVVVIVGIIVVKRAFKARNAAEIRAARAEGKAAGVVEATAARQAVVETLDTPKTVNLKQLGVEGVEGETGTVAGAVPLSQVPDDAVRYTDSATGNVYIVQRDPETDLLYWLWVTDRIHNPYWYPNTYWYRHYYHNPWAYNHSYCPWAYSGTTRTSGVIRNTGYSGTTGTVRTSTEGLAGQARVSTRPSRTTVAAQETARRAQSEVSTRPSRVESPTSTSARNAQTSGASEKTASDLGLRSGNSGTRQSTQTAAPRQESGGGFFNTMRKAATATRETIMKAPTVAVRRHVPSSSSSSSGSISRSSGITSRPSATTPSRPSGTTSRPSGGGGNPFKRN